MITSHNSISNEIKSPKTNISMHETNISMHEISFSARVGGGEARIRKEKIFLLFNCVCAYEIC